MNAPAGLDLGDAVHARRDLVGAGAAGADDGTGEASTLQGHLRRDERAERGPDLRLLLAGVGDRQQVPFVAHDPLEDETGGCDDPPGELHRRRARLDSAAVHADVDLDENSEGRPGLGGRPGEGFDLRGMVDHGDGIRAGGERDKPAELERPHERVRD